MTPEHRATPLEMVKTIVFLEAVVEMMTKPDTKPKRRRRIPEERKKHPRKDGKK